MKHKYGSKNGTFCIDREHPPEYMKFLLSVHWQSQEEIWTCEREHQFEEGDCIKIDGAFRKNGCPDGAVRSMSTSRWRCHWRRGVDLTSQAVVDEEASERRVGGRGRGGRGRRMGRVGPEERSERGVDASADVTWVDVSVDDAETVEPADILEGTGEVVEEREMIRGDCGRGGRQ